MWWLLACTVGQNQPIPQTQLPSPPPVPVVPTSPVVHTPEPGALICTPEGILPPPYAVCPTQILPTEPRGVIDLSGTDQARCDTFTGDPDSADHAIELPAEPSSYPLIIRMDPQGFMEPCTSCSFDDDTIVTRFGLALRLPSSLLDASTTALIQVPEPWRVVSGGTGKADPWPCLSGYQEFGLPTPCQVNYAGAFGIATSAVDPGPVDVWVAIVPQNQEGNCCPNVCTP